MISKIRWNIRRIVYETLKRSRNATIQAFSWVEISSEPGLVQFMSLAIALSFGGTSAAGPGEIES